MNKIKTFIKNQITKLGAKTNRKIVVFESDDWGSIRVPSKTVLSNFQKKFPDFSLDNYQQFDTLESEQDIINLSEVLSAVKDKNENPAIFTLNFTTANPDFEKIKNTNYTKFYHEKFTETYKKYYNNLNVLNEVKTGITNKVFLPQLHSREHLNSTKWLENINQFKYVKFAAENQMIGAEQSYFKNMDALNITNTNTNFDEYLTEAQSIFSDTFKFKSESFIASCYVWNNKHEKILSNNGIKYIQAKSSQNVPLKNGKLKKRLLWLGRKNKLKQTYTTRNVFFEPSKNFLKGQNPQQTVKTAFDEICYLFKHRKPAIICSHRVNYVSGVSKESAKFGLESLKLLLKMLKNEFPDIEFMSSVDFAKTI